MLVSSGARTSPKTSIETWPSFRKSCTALSWTGSLFTKGSAVLAAAKRCERIMPFLAAGSFEGTRCMWQSAHFCGLGG